VRPGLIPGEIYSTENASSSTGTGPEKSIFKGPVGVSLPHIPINIQYWVPPVTDQWIPPLVCQLIIANQSQSRSLSMEDHRTILKLMVRLGHPGTNDTGKIEEIVEVVFQDVSNLLHFRRIGWSFQLRTAGLDERT